MLAGILVGVAVIVRTRAVAAPRPVHGQDPDALRHELVALADRTSMLLGGQRIHWRLTELAEHRYGRIVAAELAVLARSGVVRLSANGDGPAEVVVERVRRDIELLPEQRLLVDALGAARVALAATRTAIAGNRWDALAADLRGLLRHRGRDPETARRLVRLRALMREHVRDLRPDFADDPRLYRLGLPFAILFSLDHASPGWPWPPTGDPAWLPPSVTDACVIATTYPGQGPSGY